METYAKMETYPKWGRTPNKDVRKNGGIHEITLLKNAIFSSTRHYENARKCTDEKLN